MSSVEESAGEQLNYRSVGKNCWDHQVKGEILQRMLAGQQKKVIILGILTICAGVAWYIVMSGAASPPPSTPESSEGGESTVGTSSAEEGAAGAAQEATESSPPSSEKGQKEAEKRVDADEVDRLIQRAASVVGHREEVPARSGRGRNPFRIGGAYVTDNADTDDEKTKVSADETEKRGVASELSLSSIIWDKKNPFAIINGRIVGVKDQIGSGIVVSEIKPQKVTLSVSSSAGDEKRRLYLKQE